MFPAGGTLRIYADSLKPNIPYKTILLSTRDTADFAVVEALEKYGLEKENPREYCIARVTTTSPQHPSSNSCYTQLKNTPPPPASIFSTSSSVIFPPCFSGLFFFYNMEV